MKNLIYLSNNFKMIKTLVLGILLFMSHSAVEAQCAVISNCDNIVANLGEGECDYVLSHQFTVDDTCPAFPFNYTQSTDMATFGIPSQSCTTGDNSYYRVFDLPAMGVSTDVNVTSVNVGIYESFAGANVIVNIYSLDGVFGAGTMVLEGTGNMNLVVLNQVVQNVSVNATVSSDLKMVVEIITPGDLIGGRMMATNNGGETGQSYYKSASCGTVLGNMTGQLVMSVVGSLDSYKIIQTDNSGLTFGDVFPVGATVQAYEIFDGAGLSTFCNFLVTVNPYISPITSMACNNLIQVSLDDNCEAFLQADEILEGGSYACYTDYEIHITNANGQDIGNHLTSSEAGQTLAVTIYSPGGNSCWGEVKVEDKVGPELICTDIQTSCAASVEPGDNVAIDVTYKAEGPIVISDGAPSQVKVEIPVFGLIGSQIQDVNVKLNIQHSDIRNLKVSLKSPSGDFVNLFIAPSGLNVTGSCTHDNLNVVMDDEATNTHTDLENACAGDVYVVDGSYNPVVPSSLSVFDTQDPNGIWELIIVDMTAGDGGELIEAKLVIRQTGAKIVLPIPSGATYVRISDNSFNVSGLDPCGTTVLTYNDVEIEQSCETNYTKIIERTWGAVDENGNVSATCIQLIYVNRTDASDIVWPRNYDDHDLNHLTCNIWGGDNYPGPDDTGWPTAISGDLCDNIQIFTPTDIRIDICESSYKILRHWKVVEWCTGDVLEHDQIIKVLDDRIEIECPTEEIEGMEGTFSCLGYVTLPLPNVKNECSTWMYEVKWFKEVNDLLPTTEGVSYNSSTNQYTIEGLREGINVVEYTAIDSCGNIASCSVEVNVEDNISPTAVCDQFTTVSIAANGESIIHAISFDDGSTDNCGIVYYDARKMTNICVGFDTKWHEDVVFCCEEIGTVVMVEFRVTDANGNRNSCMVEVTVEDKLQPYITECPDHILIKCTEDFTDLAITGEPVYVDNCGVDSVWYADNIDIDNCGRGTVERVWTVIDGVGLKNSCTQVITIYDDKPFVTNDITWPENYDTHGCDDDLHPDNFPSKYGYPRFKREDACNLVASTFKDQRFDIVDGSCVKILRTWTVIDWCTYNEKDVNDYDAIGIWSYVQVIKLTNQVAPEFDLCEDFEVCGYVPCNEYSSVTLTQSATDDCTDIEELYWFYEIDLWRDGSVDFFGESDEVTKLMPYGDHTITWLVGDKCGNTTRCIQKFNVKECKNPTPYCLGNVVTTVMNNNGEIEIWASDFNLGSYDNCTAEEDLIYSFNGGTGVNDRKKTITCADMPNGEEAYIPIDIWVIDEAGNKDFCEVVLLVQDNESNFCDPQDGAIIAGNIMTENEVMIPGAMVSYSGETSENHGEMMTLENGEYTFNVDMGTDYSLSIAKSDDPMNGVSTLDLLLIQRHILKLKKFTSPYKIIAADIDNNEVINALDLINLRKLILGKVSSFPSTQSEWRFVDRSFVFADTQHPFPFSEEILVENLSSNVTNQQFYGVKIGDVNNDITLNTLNNELSDDRSDVSLDLYTTFEDFRANQEVVLPITVRDVMSVSGMQFTMDINTDIVSYEGITAGVLGVTEQNLGLDMLERGKITFSWNKLDAIKLNSDDVLFSVVFNSIKEGNTVDVLELNSEVTKSEVYNESLETGSIEFGIKFNDDIEAPVLYQNTPNPFVEETEISFYLPEATSARLTIYDVAGRVVKTVDDFYPKGMNTVSFDTRSSNVSGLVYYQIEAKNFTAIKKMIILE